LERRLAGDGQLRLALASWIGANVDFLAANPRASLERDEFSPPFGYTPSEFTS
jgi:hypothetical protein